MTKKEIRDTIMDLDPTNTIAASASHAELSNELARVKSRRAEETAVPPVMGTVRFRIEDAGFTWRIEAEDYLGQLEYGPVLPSIGSRVPGDESPIDISEHSPGLPIRAGDLEFREKFDARRIYLTKNGHNVVFKRVDQKTGKPVLWSFQQSMEIIVGVNAELTREGTTAKPVAGSGRKMNQKNLASYLISKNPGITGSELTAILLETFPNSRIGERHGPHYLSLSRSGHLPEASEDDPRGW